MTTRYIAQIHVRSGYVDITGITPYLPSIDSNSNSARKYLMGNENG